MIKRFAWIVFLFCALSPIAHAGRAGGHVTKWDFNLLGGGWVCIMGAVPGCSQGFNATCDGVTDDLPAVLNFLTFATAQTAIVNVYFPPGAKCTAFGAWNGSAAVKKLNVWAYGASFPISFIYPDFPNTATGLIQSANIGDTIVNLINPGDTANFSVGDWVCACGLELQHGGFPPSLAFVNYRMITAINGITGAITLHSPLTVQLLSTWPLADIKDGPAALWRMDPAWNAAVSFYGVENTTVGQSVMAGREISFTNTTMKGGVVNNIAPSANAKWSAFFSGLGSPEVDKAIERMILYRGGGAQLLFQSSSTDLQMIGANWGVILGTPTSIFMAGSTTPSMRLGPIAFGVGGPAVLIGSTIGAGSLSSRGMDSTTPPLLYNNGTFSIAKVLSAYGILGWGVPGGKYYFADSDCSNNGNPQINFNVTAMRQDGVNFLPVTISNASPAVVTLASHGFTAGTGLAFQQPNGSGLDAMPSPLVTNFQYFVLAAGLTTNTFEISISLGGSPINTTTAGSGLIVVTTGNFFADTGSWVQNGTSISTPSTLPTVLCNGHNCPVYCPYQASSVSQISSGPTDMTIYAAPP